MQKMRSLLRGAVDIDALAGDAERKARRRPMHSSRP